MPRDSPDQGESIRPRLQPRTRGVRTSPRMLVSPGQGHTRGVRRGVSPVAQANPAQDASSFSYSTPVQTATNPGPRHLRPETSSSKQHFRTKAPRNLSPPGRARSPRNGPPLLVSHTGFPSPNRPRPAPHLFGHRLRGPGGHKGPGPARGRPCPRCLPAFPGLPITHIRFPAAAAATAARSSGSFQTSRYFVSDVKPRPPELPISGPAREPSPVSSFPALASLAAGPRGRGGARRKGAGPPAWSNDCGENPELHLVFPT
nr:sprouty-related, EVH1 domain-containing protein 3-like [Gorilla gorilla gorilla]